MLHLQTPPSSVKEGKQKCEPVLKGQGHEDIAVLVPILCFSHYLAPYHKYSYNDMKKTSTKFHQEALPLMVFLIFASTSLKVLHYMTDFYPSV